jgi:hypothetical protein
MVPVAPAALALKVTVTELVVHWAYTVALAVKG